ncbi:hypothetical protein L3X38_001745 [Prunus dulcis]|uniref:RNase H type-1 domain-containing protein n=1 Tax=Prunus dulcis TaxID=3755 RepID=A0AAD4WSM3_PRUDU|nr:hypothetical protein L3X38_001745 [Prunus dulcis]
MALNVPIFCLISIQNVLYQNFDGIEWLASLPHTKAADGPNVLSKTPLLCWQIWEARNNCFFKDIDPHPVRVLNVAGRIGLDYWKINSCPSQKYTGMVNIMWKPPPLDWVKVNFDGSMRGNLATTGFVIRDWNGNVRLAGAKNSCQVSITVAECLALRDGLPHDIHKGWRKILVEGHSLTPSRLWDRGLLLSQSIPFYFDLVGPACPHGFQL